MGVQVSQLKFLFAGGGTGGHLFPAIAVAEKIKSISPTAEILFVGTKTKIESRIVPKLGFRFKTIWIKGFTRKFTLENLIFPLKLLISMIQSLIINFNFRPHVAVGTGGYVAGPAIWASSLIGAKVILIEQNNFPGVTTKLLQKYADEIHLSFEESKKYLKVKDKLYMTGNPVRENLQNQNKIAAIEKFGLTSAKKILLVLGGSLGAQSINTVVAENLNSLIKLDIQIIWQTGTLYYDKYKNFISNEVKVFAFIEDMSFAYAACDLAVTRAGATSISEILYLGIPAILIPSPNVAENHQYYNAKSLEENNAAVMIEDNNLKNEFLNTINTVINDNVRLTEMSIRAKQLSKPNAAVEIANRAIQFAQHELKSKNG